MAGVFDVPSRADSLASVLSTSGTALSKDKLESEVEDAGSQVEQEERVTGDTPPARLGCAVPVVENDLLRASRVKFDPQGCSPLTRSIIGSITFILKRSVGSMGRRISILQTCNVV